MYIFSGIVYFTCLSNVKNGRILREFFVAFFNHYLSTNLLLKVKEKKIDGDQKFIKTEIKQTFTYRNSKEVKSKTNTTNEDDFTLFIHQYLRAIQNTKSFRINADLSPMTNFSYKMFVNKVGLEVHGANENLE